MARHEYVGAAPETTLSGSMTAGSPSSGGTFSVVDGTGYPTGSVGPFVLGLDAGTASEEKVLCSARTGNVFTVATTGRGYDNTIAASHGGGTSAGTVNHIFDAASATDFAGHVYDITRDDHTQYQKKSLLTAAGDLVYATGSAVWARLAIGTSGKFLKTTGSAPSWATLASADISDFATAVLPASAGLSAGAFARSQGSPSLDALGVAWPWGVWLLDEATTERVGAEIIVPAGWATVDVDVWWLNASSGSGDVRWDVHVKSLADAGTIADGTSALTTVTSAGQDVLKKSILLTGVSVTAGQLLAVSIGRVGGDAADTLGNDVGVAFVNVRKAS